MPRRVRRIRRVRKLNRRRGRRPARTLVPKQIARISETIDFADLAPGINYNFNFNLSQFMRASTLAPSFKFYKATKVTWTIEPLYNTFQDGTAGTEVTMPYMYFIMNRTQDNALLSLPDFQAMGCKPQKLISKKVIKYRPNWCSPGLALQVRQKDLQTGLFNYTATPSMGLQTNYNWLQCPNAFIPEPERASETNPYTPNFAYNTVTQQFDSANNYANIVVYNGHSVIIDQGVTTGPSQPCAKLVCTVEWSFKDPQCSYLDISGNPVFPAKTVEPQV